MSCCPSASTVGGPRRRCLIGGAAQVPLSTRECVRYCSHAFSLLLPLYPTEDETEGARHRHPHRMTNTAACRHTYIASGATPAVRHSPPNRGTVENHFTNFNWAAYQIGNGIYTNMNGQLTPPYPANANNRHTGHRTDYLSTIRDTNKEQQPRKERTGAVRGPLFVARIQ